MKKLLVIIVICLFGLYAQSQNNSYEGNANTITNFASSGAPTAFGLTKSNVVNAGVFSDTSAANAVNYLKNYNGCQIVTYSGGVKFWIRYGGSWNQVSSGSSGWGLLGNAGTVAGTNFIGTTDSQNLVLKKNNSNAATFYTNGKIDFGTGNSPASPFTNSSFRFFLDQNDRTDIFVNNESNGNIARAGFFAANDVDNYVGLSVLGSNFTLDNPSQSNAWANKVLLQTAGVGKGLVITSNEGAIQFSTNPADSTNSYINYNYPHLWLSGANRHYGGRTSAIGTIGMGTSLPRALLDIYAGDLNFADGDQDDPDYKRLFRASGKMPSGITSDFPAASFEIDNVDFDDKQILFRIVKNGSEEPLRIDGKRTWIKQNNGDNQILIDGQDNTIRMNWNGGSDGLLTLGNDSLYMQTNGADNHLFLNSSQLDVSAAGKQQINIDASGDVMSLMKNGGSVGIGLGSSTPSTELEVAGALKVAQKNDAFLDYNSVFGVHSNGYTYFQGDANGFIIGSNNNRTEQLIMRSSAASSLKNTIQFYTNNSHKMTIASNGNVGIGSSITSPYSKLHVDGTIRGTDSVKFTGLISSSLDTANKKILVIDAGGNVTKSFWQSGGTTYSAGLGLSLSSNTFSLDTSNASVLSRQRAASTYLPLSGGTLTGSLATPYVAKTADYTATATDYTIHFTSGTSTFTLPTAVGITGRIYVVRNDSGNYLTFATTSSQTINGGAPAGINSGNVITFQSTGTNWIILN